MKQIQIEQNNLHSLFEPGQMTFVGAIDPLQCFILGSQQGKKQNNVLKTYMGDGACDDVYVVGSDADGNPTDITVERLTVFLTNTKPT